jgi:hypothetical protein
LNGIFCVLGVAQQAPADSEDHRSVTVNQDFKSRLCGPITAGDKAIEKLPVRQALK